MMRRRPRTSKGLRARDVFARAAARDVRQMLVTNLVFFRKHTASLPRCTPDPNLLDLLIRELPCSPSSVNENLLLGTSRLRPLGQEAVVLRSIAGTTRGHDVHDRMLPAARDWNDVIHF